MSQQGFQPRGTLAGDLTQATLPFIVSNAVTVTAGNAVTLVNGYLENIASTSTTGILGVAAETVKGTSTSLTCAVYCDPNLVYYNTAETALVITSVGKVFKVATTSGKQYISATSGAVNSANHFIMLKRDPDDTENTKSGLFKIYGGITFNKTLAGLE